MPVQIETVINEITPQSNQSGESEGDGRWQRQQEIEAHYDHAQAMQMRLNGEDFND